MDLLLHVTMPALVLLAAGVRARYAIGLAPLGVLPDLDGFSAAGHRMYLHNVYVLVAVALVAYVVARRFIPRDAMLIAGVAAFCLGSHFLLDLGDPIGLLYPLSDAGVYVRPAVVGDFRTEPHVFFPSFEWGAVRPDGGWSYPDVPRVEEPDLVHPAVSTEAILVVVLALLAQAVFRWGLPLRAAARRAVGGDPLEPDPQKEL
ncbi:MAG TPA: metal-dependent hydrolase [Candidatus Thermoplasmatota archaeon]|nr:metal-dependent hydrolase [Candidatus Thermoplasmatota archaeon]